MNGSNDSINYYSTTGSVAGIIGTGDTVTGSGETVWLETNGDSASINGNNNQIDTSSGVTSANTTLNGSYDQASLGNSDQTTLNGNYNTIIGATSDTITTQGMDNIVTAGSSNVLKLTGGTGDTFFAASGDTVNVTANSANGLSDVIVASNANITIANNERVDVFGSNDTFTLGQFDYVGTWGSGDVISAGANDGIWLENSGGDTVTGSTGDAVNVNEDYQNSSTDTVDMTGGVVNVSDNGVANINGSYDYVDQGSGISISYGNGDSNNATYNNSSGYVGYSGDGNDSGGGDGGDPLVLNLSGGAVQTTSLANSSVYFNVQNTSQNVQTAWITSGEGFLVYAPTFYSKAVMSAAGFVKSFSALAALDTNKNGKIDQGDSTWTNLYVWTPTNGGVYSQSDLHNMGYMGITSINLSATVENQSNNNNVIIKNGSFTTSGGATDNISEVYLQFNEQNVSSTIAKPATASIYTLPGNGSGSNFQLGSGNVNIVQNTSGNLNNSTIAGFGSLDQIDITDLSFGQNTTLSFTENSNNTSGTLTVANAAHNATLQLFGQFLAAGFQDAPDSGAAGTVVAYVPPAANYSLLAAGH